MKDYQIMKLKKRDEEYQKLVSLTSHMTVRQTYRWIVAMLSRQYPNLCYSISKDNKGYAIFSFSEPHWSADQSNCYETYDAKEAILYCVAEYYSGY